MTAKDGPAGGSSYRELFDADEEHPTTFWAQAAKELSWMRERRRVLDDRNPQFCQWFPYAESNTCASGMDRHVAGGRAEQPALIHDSLITGAKRTHTYRELLSGTPGPMRKTMRGIAQGKDEPLPSVDDEVRISSALGSGTAGRKGRTW